MKNEADGCDDTSSESSLDDIPSALESTDSEDQDDDHPQDEPAEDLDFENKENEIYTKKLHNGTDLTVAESMLKILYILRQKCVNKKSIERVIITFGFLSP